MKSVQCQMCGSTVFKRIDKNTYQCQSCGTKHMQSGEQSAKGGKKGTVAVIMALIVLLLALCVAAHFIVSDYLGGKGEDGEDTSRKTRSGSVLDLFASGDSSDDTVTDWSASQAASELESYSSSQGGGQSGQGNSRGSSSYSTQSIHGTFPAASATPECVHNYVEQTETVNHPEEGHWSTEQDARKVTKYKCAVCYLKFASTGEYYSHFDSSHVGGAYSILRDRYETVSDWEYYDKPVWVVDKPAYNEIVITGYKCSKCGAPK